MSSPTSQISRLWECHIRMRAIFNMKQTLCRLHLESLSPNGFCIVKITTLISAHIDSIGFKG